MKATDGKMRETDVAETQVLLRIIQSIPSPKAEPFKQWLAKVGYERMQEIVDPEQSLDRARENWQKLGLSEKWIQQRMTGQETRNKLTDYWKESGVQKNDEFAFLTNIIHTEWAGLSVKQHKSLKGLKTQNLRDHMSEAELILTLWQTFLPGKLQKPKRQKVSNKIQLQERKEEKLPKKQGWHWRIKQERKLSQAKIFCHHQSKIRN